MYLFYDENPQGLKLSGSLLLSRIFYNQPQSGVSINWNNPITKSLVSCILPGLSNIDIISGAILSSSSGGGIVPTTSIIGKVGKASANNAAIYTTAPPSVKNGEGSILWHGTLLGSAPSASPCLCGVTYNSTNTVPYVALELKRKSASSDNIYLDYNNSTSADTILVTASNSYTTGTGTVIGTRRIGRSELFTHFNNGPLLSVTDAIAGSSINYTTTSRLECGDSLNSRNPNAEAAIVLLWSRTLSSIEAHSLSINPWQIFKVSE